MSNYSHGVMTAGTSRKRKLGEGLDAAKTSSDPAAQADPSHDNRLLAGYLAHEFLTKGTLFGKKWDPARADSGHAPATAPRSDVSSNRRPIANGQLQVDPRAKSRAYAEMAHLLKTDGAHIPDIVNPTQLGRWIQM